MKGKGNLNILNTAANPYIEFKKWLDEAVKKEVSYPNAMTLSTVSLEGIPSSRIVLLQKIKDNEFVFFTNYKSMKADEISKNENVALNFHWKSINMQIRILGNASKTSKKISDEYFANRRRGSKISAWSSEQSSKIEDRKTLETKYSKIENRFSGEEIPRPEFWGGYGVKPYYFEFWMEREYRFHDRIIYNLQAENNWIKNRLQP